MSALPGCILDAGVPNSGALPKDPQTSGPLQNIGGTTHATITWIAVLGRLVDFFHASKACRPGNKVNKHNQSRAGEDWTGGR